MERAEGNLRVERVFLARERERVCERERQTDRQKERRKGPGFDILGSNRVVLDFKNDQLRWRQSAGESVTRW